jgi:polar amino acid transport system substrate-binding protein
MVGCRIRDPEEPAVPKLTLVFAILLALVAGACGESTSTNSAPASSTTLTAADCAKAVTLKSPGTLTIGTDNPAYSPYFTGGAGHDWKGQYNNDPYANKGFEDAVAYAVAKQLGFDQPKVTWAVTHFNQSYAPGPKNFDIYLAQVSYNDKRAQTADLSDSYYDVNQSLVALKSNDITKATTLADLKGYKLGTQIGTTSYDLIVNLIQPDSQPSVYNTTNDAVHALKAGQIDGLVVDLPTADYMTSIQIPGSTIVGQFQSTDNEHFSMVLPKNSALTPCVNKAIQELRDDGTLDQLTQTWLPVQSKAPVLQ